MKVGENMSKVLVLCVIGLIGLMANADLVLDSFCGYEFGSEYVPQPGDRKTGDVIMREGKLANPFRHFENVRLIWGTSGKLRQVNISFNIPRDWTYSMFRTELFTIRDILTEKYNVKFAIPERNPNTIESDPNAVYGFPSDTTTISAGLSTTREDIQFQSFTIVVCREDITKEDRKIEEDRSREYYRRKREAEKEKINKGMKGGGAEVL